MTDTALANAREYAQKMRTPLAAVSLVWSYSSKAMMYGSLKFPRAHTTLVTMISQDLPQFSLHVRAILGLPIPNITQHSPSASAVILVEGESDNVRFGNLNAALAAPDTQLRLFGKPHVKGKRRMGVAIARAETIDAARAKARAAAEAVEVQL